MTKEELVKTKMTMRQISCEVMNKLEWAEAVKQEYFTAMEQVEELRKEYKELDRKLAVEDGRLKVVKIKAQAKEKKQVDLKSAIKGMNKDQLEELRALLS